MRITINCLLIFKNYMNQYNNYYNYKIIKYFKHKRLEVNEIIFKNKYFRDMKNKR